MSKKQKEEIREVSPSGNQSISLNVSDETKPKNEEVIAHKFKVQFDVGYTGGPLNNGEINNEGSQTVPDMNLTVRQLLEKHVRGENGNIEVKQPLYFDVKIPQMHDITDVVAWKDHLKNQIQETENFLREELAKQNATEEESRRQESASSVDSDEGAIK